MSDSIRKRSAIACLFGLALGACNDTEDRVAADDLIFELEGSVCGTKLSYRAPPSARLTLVVTPSGRVGAVVVADGPLIRFNDPQALAAYAEDHEMFATISLEEPARLDLGELGVVSAANVGAREVGSAALSGLTLPKLEITEYEPGRMIAGTLTDDVNWFTDLYPEGANRTCLDGELTLRFRGAYELWDGQRECFSPSRNLDRLERELVLGCACEAQVDEAVCVTLCDDPQQSSGVDASCDGQAVALFCIDEQWQSGHDGPCGN